MRKMHMLSSGLVVVLLSLAVGLPKRPAAQGSDAYAASDSLGDYCYTMHASCERAGNGWTIAQRLDDKECILVKPKEGAALRSQIARDEAAAKHGLKAQMPQRDNRAPGVCKAPKTVLQGTASLGVPGDPAADTYPKPQMVGGEIARQGTLQPLEGGTSTAQPTGFYQGKKRITVIGWTDDVSARITRAHKPGDTIPLTRVTSTNGNIKRVAGTYVERADKRYFQITRVQGRDNVVRKVSNIEIELK